VCAYGAGYRAHQLLPAHGGRCAEALYRIEAAARLDTGCATTRARVRDLCLLATRRGGASPWWQGGARRVALVRPAGGLPYRSTGTGQGTAGQERGDRAG